MNFSEIELPSNRRFGIFFSAIFGLAAAYFYYTKITGWSYTFGFIGLAFFTVAIIKADALLPLNKLWMKFGVLLGIIISPIVLGIIFFGLFTPIAFFMLLTGRDELRLKFAKKASYWNSRIDTIKSDSFKKQF